MKIVYARVEAVKMYGVWHFWNWCFGIVLIPICHGETVGYFDGLWIFSPLIFVLPSLFTSICDSKFVMNFSLLCLQLLVFECALNEFNFITDSWPTYETRDACC